MEQSLTVLGYFLFVLTFTSLSILSILRPSVVAAWAKSAHPRFAGDASQLLLIVKLIGVGGLLLSVLFALPIIRALLRN